MPSITELREQCQSHRFKILNLSWSERINRKFSIYFTWIFIKMGINANVVSMIALLSLLIAGILFSFNSALLFGIGIILTQLYHTLDTSDGEVARYRKESSLTGLFVDRISGELAEPFFYAGISLSVAVSVNFELWSIYLIIFSIIFPALTRGVLGGYHASIIDGIESNTNVSGVLYKEIIKNSHENITETMSTEYFSNQSNFLIKLVWFTITGSGKPIILSLVLLFDFYIYESTPFSFIGRLLFLFYIMGINFSFTTVFIYNNLKNSLVDINVSILKKNLK